MMKIRIQNDKRGFLPFSDNLFNLAVEDVSIKLPAPLASYEIVFRTGT